MIILKNRLKKVLNLLRKLNPEIVERIEKLIDKEKNFKYEGQKEKK